MTIERVCACYLLVMVVVVGGGGEEGKKEKRYSCQIKAELLRI